MFKRTERTQGVKVFHKGVNEEQQILLKWKIRTEKTAFPLSSEFSRQEYWISLPFRPPGDLPNPGIEPLSLVSPALPKGFFTTVSSGKAPFEFIQPPEEQHPSPARYFPPKDT